jgi:hypothetical protein
MHRWLFSLLTVLFLLCFMCQTSHSRQPETPKRNIDMNLTFSTEPDTSKECTVTFTFTPMEEIDHRIGLDDEAKIYFLPKDAIEIISGDTAWSGKLTKGKTELIQVVFKPIHPAYLQLDAVIRSGRVDPKSAYRHRVATAKLVKAYERAFAYRNIISKHFLIGEPPVMETEYTIVDSCSGKIIKKRVRVDSPFLPAPVPVDDVGRLSTGSSQNRIAQFPATISGPNIKKLGFSINGNKTWFEKENAYLLGDIKLSIGEHAEVYLYECQRVNTVKTDFELLGDCCSMKKKEDDWIELTAGKNRNSCKLIGVYNQTKYLINISVDDSTLEKVPSDSAPNR